MAAGKPILKANEQVKNTRNVEIKFAILSQK